MKLYNIFKLDFENKKLIAYQSFLATPAEIKRHLSYLLLEIKGREDFEVNDLEENIYITNNFNGLGLAAAPNFSPESIKTLQQFVSKEA